MIQAKNISVKFGNKTILDNINFNLSPGKVMALVGANGAGKSTLLKAIAGDVPFSGNLLFKGKTISSISKNELAKEKAVMEQSTQVGFDFSVHEVTMMGRYPHFEQNPTNEDVEVVEHSLRKVGLNDKIQRTHTSLSGGEKQRNHFARTLSQVTTDCKRSKLFILDEPLNNLDIQYQYKLMQEIKSFVEKGNAAIVVLHDINMAAHFADEIVMLKEGEILAQGATNKVLNSRLLESCYDLKVVVDRHPINGKPMVFFDYLNTNQESINIQLTAV
jgi:iron complex transport system ATP-binding protein